MVECGLLVGLIVVGLIGSLQNMGTKVDASLQNSNTCLGETYEDREACYYGAGMGIPKNPDHREDEPSAPDTEHS